MSTSPDPSLSATSAELDLPRGIWKLSLDMPAGDWSACRLSTGNKSLAHFDAAQDLLVWSFRDMRLTLQPVAGSTSKPGIQQARDHAARLFTAYARQLWRSPRASLLAIVSQLREGRLAVPVERQDWPEAASPDDVVFDLAAGIELADGAAGRIASVLRDPAIRFVSWDIAGEGDGILPRPSRHLHRSLPYTWRASAHRLGEAPIPPQDLPPGAWRHLHEALACRTGPVPPCPVRPNEKPSAPLPDSSVIIPTRDNPALLRSCLKGLERSIPAPSQLVLVDHLTVEPEALSLLDAAEAAGAVRIRAEGQFNFSRLCNLGAAAATGEVLVFLNNDVVAETPDWLSSLTHLLGQPGIGVTGAELHYPDGRLQHAGIVNSPENGPQHVATGRPGSDRGPLGLLDHTRECLAVSGACLATRRDIFEALGGFDEAFPEDFNDVDYCLRAREAGYATLMTPGARLVHHESRTRDTQGGPARKKRQEFLALLEERHPLLAEPDPYFSPRWETSPPLYRLKRWRR